MANTRPPSKPPSAAASAPPSASSPDSLLRTAIAERRVIEFVLNGCRRVAEPHDYGVIRGETRLFFYQTGGESRSGDPVGWRWAVLSKISELHLLDERFLGPRAGAGERHVNWDILFASVSSNLRPR